MQLSLEREKATVPFDCKEKLSLSISFQGTIPGAHTRLLPIFFLFIVFLFICLLFASAASLPFFLQGNDSVSQVTWRFLAASPLPPPEPRPPPLVLATLSPLYGSNFAGPFDGRATFEGSRGPIGPSGSRDGTLHLSEARRADGGTYICVFTLFPRGGLQAGLELQVFVPPRISAFQANPAPVSPPLSSDSQFSHKTFTPALAAICEAWGARPPPTIHWRLSTILERLSSPGGPLWVSRSELWLQPNRTAHGQNATCVVSHPALITDVEKEVNLRVLYAPEVRVEGYDGSWYVNGPGGKLHCMVDSNPPPNVFTWTRMNDSLPAGVRLHNATLDLLAPLTPELAGTYQCHVDNGVGEGQAGIRVDIEGMDNVIAVVFNCKVRTFLTWSLGTSFYLGAIP
uniref:Ig-like domain-containing protein n=1 Tax=Eptatretus burgeri TaxID=7764 RepID=A0A8C4N5K4_EPTBU